MHVRTKTHAAPHHAPSRAPSRYGHLQKAPGSSRTQYTPAAITIVLCTVKPAVAHLWLLPSCDRYGTRGASEGDMCTMPCIRAARKLHRTCPQQYSTPGRAYACLGHGPDPRAPQHHPPIRAPCHPPSDGYCGVRRALARLNKAADAIAGCTLPRQYYLTAAASPQRHWPPRLCAAWPP